MVSFCLQLLVWHTAITMATAENPIKAPTLLMFSQGRFWDAMPCISDLWSPTCKSRCRSVAPSVNPDKPRDQREPFGSYQVLSPWPRSLAPNLGGANHVGVHHITWRWGAPQTPTERCGKGWLLLVVVVEAIQLGVNKKWNAQKLLQRCRNWIQWDGAGDWIPTCGIHHNLWGSKRTPWISVLSLAKRSKRKSKTFKLLSLLCSTWRASTNSNFVGNPPQLWNVRSK